MCPNAAGVACDIGRVCSNYRADTAGLEWIEGPSDSGAVDGAVEPDGSIPIWKTRVVQILHTLFFLSEIRTINEHEIIL